MSEQASNERKRTMNGSEKQVKWAEEIKSAVMQKMTAYRSKLESAWNEDGVPVDAPHRVKATTNYDECLAYLNSKDNAKWWIDNMKGMNSEHALVEGMFIRSTLGRRDVEQALSGK
jgi:hypothetical protein